MKSSTGDKPGVEGGTLARETWFGVLCRMFNAFAKTECNHKKKVKMLTKFYNTWKGQDPFIYPALRLIIPEMDKDRQQFGLQEPTLAKFYVEVLGIAKTDNGRMLKHWRDARFRVKEATASAGDFPGLLEYVLSKYVPAPEKSVTIENVNTMLDNLSKAENSEEKKECLRTIISSASPNEQMWICKIILKDLGIGIGAETRLKLYHEDALSVYNENVRFRACCDTLERNIADEKAGRSVATKGGGSRSNRRPELKLFNPFAPMLAKRAKIQEIFERMGTRFSIETKFDGERVLTHVQKDDPAGEKVAFYSRNSVDVTSYYGPLLEKSILENSESTCIYDGELVVWNNELGAVEPFGSNKQVALNLIRNEPEKRHLCFNVFDIVFLEYDLTSLSYTKRKQVLKKNMKNVPLRFEMVNHRSCQSKEEIMNALNHAIENNEEGIMIKHNESTYEVGQRDSGWMKLKPDYIDGLSENLDCLILGAFYAKSKGHGGALNSFLVGVSHVDEEGETVYLTVGKVGSGVSRETRKLIDEKMKSFWKPYPPPTSDPPPHLADWKAGADERPHLYTLPEHALVVELKAAEVQKSEKFSSGFALRFPRLCRVRTDKSFDYCLTLRELLELVDEMSGRLFRRRDSPVGRTSADESGRLLRGQEMKITGRRLREEVGEETVDYETESGGARYGGRRAGRGKRIKTQNKNPATSQSSTRYATRVKATPTVLPEFQSLDPSLIGIESKMFEGKEFCVFPDKEYPSDLEKRDLEAMLIKCSAKIVQNPGKNTDAIFCASAKSFRAKNWIQNQEENKNKNKNKIKNKIKNKNKKSARKTSDEKNQSESTKPSDPMALIRISKEENDDEDGKEEGFRDRDILSYTYLIDCLKHLQHHRDDNDPVPITPQHVVHATPELASKLRMIEDEWGNSHDVDDTVETLERIMSRMPQGVGEKMLFDGRGTVNELLAEDNEALWDGMGLFYQMCNFVIWFFDPELDIESNESVFGTQRIRLWLTAQRLRFAGARISEELDASVTHVIVAVDPGDALLPEVKEYLKSQLSTLRKEEMMRCGRSSSYVEKHVVSIEWAIHSLMWMGKVLPEWGYEITLGNHSRRVMRTMEPDDDDTGSDEEGDDMGIDRETLRIHIIQ